MDSGQLARGVPAETETHPMAKVLGKAEAGAESLKLYSVLIDSQRRDEFCIFMALFSRLYDGRLRLLLTSFPLPAATKALGN